MRNAYLFTVRALFGGLVALAAISLFALRHLYLGSFLVIVLAGAYSVSGED